MEKERAATSILRGISILIASGIVAQFVSIFWRGPTHHLAWWYVGLMLVLLSINVAAYLIHRGGRMRCGVLLAAWGSLACISVMVGLDAIVNRGEYPWILFTLHLAVFAIGETVGNGTLAPYSIACGAVLLATGIVHDKMDYAFLALIFLVWATYRAMRSYCLTEKVGELEAAIEIVSRGKLGQHTETD